MTFLGVNKIEQSRIVGTVPVESPQFFQFTYFFSDSALKLYKTSLFMSRLTKLTTKYLSKFTLFLQA